MRNFPSALVAFALLPGCSLVQSTSQPDGTSAEGVVYYLPKRMFQVDIERKLVPPEKLEAELKAKAAASQAAQAELEKAKGESAKLQAVADELEAIKAPSEAQKAALAEAGKAAAAAKAQLDASVKAETAAGEAYTAAKTSVINATPTGECRTTMAIKPLALGPDPALRFSADLSHSILRSDQLTLTTTPTGLLSGATGQGKDETADIILSLTNALAARRGGSGDLGIKSTAKLFGAPCPAGRASRLTDFSTKANNSLNEALLKFNLKLELSPDNTEPKAASVIQSVCTAISSKRCSDAEPYPGEDKETYRAANGLVYRRDLPYLVNLTDTTDSSRVLNAQVQMPNRSPTELVRFPTGAFTTVSYAVSFDQGMLTSVAATRPSEVLGFAKIPYDVAVALVRIPAEILKLRVDVKTQKVSLAEKDLALIKQLEAIDQAKNPAPEAPTAGSED